MRQTDLCNYRLTHNSAWKNCVAVATWSFVSGRILISGFIEMYGVVQKVEQKKAGINSTLFILGMNISMDICPYVLNWQQVTPTK